MSNFSIYRASAGSGKTFILTYNYLRLALQYPDYFKTVLAVTFTNKATEEMKSRILDTLEQLAKGKHVMSADLMTALNISDSELSARADRLLRQILHNYSFFAVTTIDAFFQKIVRSFAREVGIQTGFKIELDQPKVISEVVDQLLADMVEDQQLVKWLTDFAIYQINDGKSWDTRRDIKSLSSELFNEFVVVNKAQIFSQLDQSGFIDDFVRSIHDRQDRLVKGLTAIGEKIQSLLNSHELSKDDFVYKAAGVGGYLEKVAGGQFVEPGKRVYDALEQGKWYSKDSESQPAVDEALANGLDGHLSEAIDYYFEHNTEFQSLNQVIKYIYTYGLLSRIADEVNNYRESNDLLLIADFPIFLNQIIHDSDAHYIYEKVGTRYKHYLIDEFQDTSGLQWNNFKPLIQETLSAGNFSMVVGDVKQSIYRWRGGNWKILLEQIRQDIGEELIRDEGLATNRRSKQNIVEFNNDLFQQAPGILEESLEQQLGQAIRGKLSLDAAYQGSTQQLFDESGEGLVDLHFFEKDEALEDSDAYVLEVLIKHLQFLQDANYRLSDIAILIRTNPQGRKIVKGLMEYQLANPDDGYHYDVISNESLSIKNNAAVHLLLQALVLVASPQQALAQAQLKYAHRQYIDHIESGNSETADAKEFPVQDWGRLSLSQLVQAVIRYFTLESQDKDRAYLMAFQDLVLDYLKYEKDSLIDFLSWWSNNDQRSIQVSEDQEAIRLMTIHKSKGLQFKAVILPYGQWKLDHSGTNEQLLWCGTQGSEVLSKVPYVPVRYRNDLAQTIFNQDFYQEKSDIYLDNLNLLYVALTRAEEALFVISQVNATAKRISQVGDILFQYSRDKMPSSELPASVTLGQLPEYSSYDQPLGATRPLNYVGDPSPEDRLKFRGKSRILDPEVVESINYGQIIHWIFSMIRSKKDFALALNKAALKFGLTETEMKEIKEKLREIWDIPKIAQWFEPDWDVKNESSILLTNGKLKRPDRVIVKNNQAVIIDYKTGVFDQKHLRQVQEYKDILTDMGYEKTDGYLIYLSKPELVAV